MRFTVLSLLGLGLLLGACEPATSSEPVATSTHALLRIERSERVGSDADAASVAFAGVVRVPEAADPELLLRLSGQGPVLPPLGQCASQSRERDASAASELGRAEFLDAGEVVLGASGAHTLLAPRAFPTEVPGVVYTSRDRASDSLRGGAAYLLKTTGSEQLAPVELRVQAPEELFQLTVAGEPVGALGARGLSTSSDVPLSWRAGDARDVVYVEVIGSAERGSLGLCAFRDADGRGSLPRGLFGATGSGSLAFHRLREVAADVTSQRLDGAEVSFDFAQTAAVSFR